MTNFRIYDENTTLKIYDSKTNELLKVLDLIDYKLNKAEIHSTEIDFNPENKNYGLAITYKETGANYKRISLSFTSLTDSEIKMIKKHFFTFQY